jgi:hypothetical protein
VDLVLRLRLARRLLNLPLAQSMMRPQCELDVEFLKVSAQLVESMSARSRSEVRLQGRDFSA